MDLNDYRKEIDSIDDQLIALFAKRMETAEKIAAYKKANGLRVLDAHREKEKMREILEKTPDNLREYVSSLYSLIFELSRSRQSCLLGTKGDLPAKIAGAIEKTPQLFPEDAAVACQGVEGAYSEQACERLFKRPSTFFFSSFEAVFSAIEKGLESYFRRARSRHQQETDDNHHHTRSQQDEVRFIKGKVLFVHIEKKN